MLLTSGNSQLFLQTNSHSVCTGYLMRLVMYVSLIQEYNFKLKSAQLSWVNKVLKGEMCMTPIFSIILVVYVCLWEVGESCPMIRAHIWLQWPKYSIFAEGLFLYKGSTWWPCACNTGALLLSPHLQTLFWFSDGEFYSNDRVQAPHSITRYRWGGIFCRTAEPDPIAHLSILILHSNIICISRIY